MAKTLRVRTRAGWTTKPAADLPENRLTAVEVDDTLLALEDGAIAIAEKGAANGVATLGADAKIPESQLPAVAITDVFAVGSEAAMLALTAQRGDVAIRSDLNKSFALAAEPATVLANWLELRTPTDAVLSVAGKTGAVTLAKADVGLGNVDNTSDASKPISTATQNALDAKAADDTSYNKGNITGATTFNLADGKLQYATVTGAVSWAFAGWPAAPKVGSITVELTNGGAFTQAWNGVKWDSGTPPSLSLGTDVLTFYSRDGATVRGAHSIKDSK